jgi:SAM-dependent methyltransferase
MLARRRRERHDAAMDAWRTRRSALAPGYDPQAYWIARHEQLRGDIRSVGNKGLSQAENEAAYRERAEALRQFLPDCLGPPAGRSAVEFGCGIGMVAVTLVELGLVYTGVDISPVALADARLRCPAGTFLEGDIRSFRAPQPFDLAVAAYVLCHIVDDADWHAVLAALARAVRPGGAFLLIDSLPEGEPRVYGDYVRHRPRLEMAQGMAAHGLHLQTDRSRGDLHIAWRR